MRYANILLLAATAATLLPAASPAAFAAAAGDDVLARWRGGSLTRETFTTDYDPRGEALQQGGEELRAALCKAVYVEIYHHRALAAGLDRDPDFEAGMSAWRQRRLAALYRSRRQPDFAAQITAETVAAAYERDPQRFAVPGRVDLDVLFVRCGAGDGERGECRSRMAAHRRRLDEGAELAAILAEERQHSGEANGSFRGVVPARLSADLRAAVDATEPGSIAGPIETPIGLYLIRVADREPPVPLPLERVEPRIRREMTAELAAAWLDGETRRLSAELAGKVAADAGEEALFAAAARAQGLDEEPDFAAREADARRWMLADRAFYQDAEVLPSDRELESQLREDPRIAERYRQVRLVLAVVDAGGDRYATLRAADQVAEALRETADPGGALRRLAANRTEVRVEEIGPMTLGEVRRHHRALLEVVEELAPGEWKGPFPYGDGGGGARSAALVVLEEARPARLSEVRDAMLEEFRSHISADPETFLATVGRRWEIAIPTPPEKTPDAPSH